jgi:hypothetical protein
MSHMTAQLVATLLLIALIIVAGPYLCRLGGGIEAGIERLNAELQHRLADLLRRNAPPQRSRVHS